MSQDLLIPFLPRIVQNKLERPKLNVKRISKEPRVSEDGHQSETQQEVYEQNNLVVAQRLQAQEGTRSSNAAPSNQSLPSDSNELTALNEQAENQLAAGSSESKNKTAEATEAQEEDMAFQLHTVRTKQEIEQALAKQAAFEHPVYDKEEILNHDKNKNDSQMTDAKNGEDDDHHVDIIV